MSPQNGNAHHPHLQKLIQQRGGEYDLTWLDGLERGERVWSLWLRLRQHGEFVAGELLTRPRRRFSLVVFQDTKMSAFAATATSPEDRPEDLVGISIGTFHTVVHSFQRLLAHPLAFPEIGQPQLEDAGRAVRDGISNDVLGCAEPYIEPICPQRAAFAQMLAEAAIDFLYFHEVTHISDGHLGYLEAQGRPVAALLDGLEGAEMGPNILGNELRRAMELDADEAAVSFCALMAPRRYRHFPVPNQPSWTVRLETPMAFAVTLFGVYFLWRLLGRAWDPDTEMGRHPPASVRLAQLPLSLASALLVTPGSGFTDREAAQRQAYRWVGFAEHAFALLQGWPAPDLAVLRSVTGRSARWQAVLDEYRRAWAALRKELAPFVRNNDELPD